MENKKQTTIETSIDGTVKIVEKTNHATMVTVKNKEGETLSFEAIITGQGRPSEKVEAYVKKAIFNKVTKSKQQNTKNEPKPFKNSITEIKQAIKTNKKRKKANKKKQDELER
jgi:hypothetical protein